MLDLPLPPALLRKIRPEDLTKDIRQVLCESATDTLQATDKAFVVNGTHAITFKDLFQKYRDDTAIQNEAPTRIVQIGELGS
jgi:hypothetical protein